MLPHNQNVSELKLEVLESGYFLRWDFKHRNEMALFHIIFTKS